MVMRRTHTYLLLAILLTASLLSTNGCDPTVDVLRPSDRYRYSLFGALNVAADTQVIRVDPIGTPTQVGVSPGLDVSVVLRNLDSGEEIPLRDSLTAMTADTLRMYNFWTTDPIRPGTSYEVAVMNDSTDLTTATTTTPVQAPDLTVRLPIRVPCDRSPRFQEDLIANNSFEVKARNVDHIAAAITHYPIIYPRGGDTLRTWVPRDHYDKVTDEGNRFSIYVFYLPDLRSVNPGSSADCSASSDFFRSAARMVVAAGGPQWPAWRNASLNDLARPNQFSNVEGGHGFVGGVYTDTVRVPIYSRQ